MKRTKHDTITRKTLTLTPLTIRTLSAATLSGGMTNTARCTFDTCPCTLDCGA
jgi:hypothetical protein